MTVSRYVYRATWLIGSVSDAATRFPPYHRRSTKVRMAAPKTTVSSHMPSDIQLPPTPEVFSSNAIANAITVAMTNAVPTGPCAGITDPSTTGAANFQCPCSA